MTIPADPFMARTVTGDLPVDELGVVHCHEHLLMTGGWPVMREPDHRLDSVPAAIAEVRLFQRAGGGAVVEMTPLGFGRDPDGMREVSEATGVRIIAATGWHKSQYYADNHWTRRADPAAIAELLVAEVEVGMDRNSLDSPIVDRSPARAGIVKLATEYHRAAVYVERLVEAIGETHRRTGVPIGTHTEHGTMGHRQLDLLERHGVPAGAVLLGHIDHNPDPVLLGELAARGAYLVLDMPGRAKYGPDSACVALIESLVSSGHADRLLLGMDLARRSYWPTLGGGPGLDYVLTVFIPRLRATGLIDTAQAALIDNPRRALRLRT